MACAQPLGLPRELVIHLREEPAILVVVIAQRIARHLEGRGDQPTLGSPHEIIDPDLCRAASILFHHITLNIKILTDGVLNFRALFRSMLISLHFHIITMTCHN